MRKPHLLTSIRPPGVQAALFHLPYPAPPRYSVFDCNGNRHTLTTSLGVAATAARYLVAQDGEAWVRTADDVTARVDERAVTSDRPDHPWIKTLTSTLEATR